MTLVILHLVTVCQLLTVRPRWRRQLIQLGCDGDLLELICIGFLEVVILSALLLNLATIRVVGLIVILIVPSVSIVVLLLVVIVSLIVFRSEIAPGLINFLIRPFISIDAIECHHQSLA